MRFICISALASIILTVSGRQIPFQSDVMSNMYPKHTLYTLNDGNLIPSPAFGVGTALFNQDATEAVLLALKNGYRHIDNARIYGNEKSVGKAIKESGIRRDELYITTKYDAIQGEDVRSEFMKSLKDLGVDYVDLYLIHFPRAAVQGGGIQKVWPVMESLKREGLARSIGVSNYQVEEMEELLKLAEIKPAANQIRLHVYNWQENLPVMALSKKHGIITESYSALTPITKSPGGPADEAGEKIAHRLSKETSTSVTVGMAIEDWLRTRGVVAVTTSSKDFRQKEQLRPFAKHFPLLTDAEAEQYEASGRSK